MFEVRINRFAKNQLSIRLFESIDELPVRNFSAFNKYLMIDSGIGSDFDEIDRTHIQAMFKTIESPEKLKKELQNLRSLVNNMLSDVNVKHLAFACLIHSIDGETLEDLSQTNLEKVIRRLSDAGLTDSDLKKNSGRQKISFMMNLKHFSRRILPGPPSIIIMQNSENKTIFG